ncbi:MAG: acyl carrier protein [Eubacteriales bacterium]|nr:acyl carrier protein [Eubacteriales bacterium]
MTFEKVKEIIMETINCDEEKITLEASLKEDLDMDSLDAMELSMALEEAYDITIDEDELQNFVTVKNIVEYLDSQNA